MFSDCKFFQKKKNQKQGLRRRISTEIEEFESPFLNLVYITSSVDIQAKFDGYGHWDARNY